jgi:hypothetical protein
VSALAGGLGSLLGGAVAEVSFLLAFGVSGTFVLMGAALVYRLRNTLEEDLPSNGPEAPPPDA